MGHLKFTEAKQFQRATTGSSPAGVVSTSTPSWQVVRNKLNRQWGHLKTTGRLKHGRWETVRNKLQKRWGHLQTKRRGFYSKLGKWAWGGTKAVARLPYRAAKAVGSYTLNRIKSNLRKKYDATMNDLSTAAGITAAAFAAKPAWKAYRYGRYHYNRMRGYPVVGAPPHFRHIFY